MARINILKDKIFFSTDSPITGQEFAVSFRPNNRELFPGGKHGCDDDFPGTTRGHLADATLIVTDSDGNEVVNDTIYDLCVPVTVDAGEKVTWGINIEDPGRYNFLIRVNPHGNDPPDDADAYLRVTENSENTGDETGGGGGGGSNGGIDLPGGGSPGGGGSSLQWAIDNPLLTVAAVGGTYIVVTKATEAATEEIV